MALRLPWSKKNPIEDEKGQLHDYIEILTEDLAQLNASKFAIQKCVAMIANAISKSEIVIQGKSAFDFIHHIFHFNK